MYVCIMQAIFVDLSTDNLLITILEISNCLYKFN